MVNFIAGIMKITGNVRVDSISLKTHFVWFLFDCLTTKDTAKIHIIYLCNTINMYPIKITYKIIIHILMITQFIIYYFYYIN